MESLAALQEENHKLKDEVRRLRSAFALGLGRIRPTGEGVGVLESRFPHVAAKMVAYWRSPDLIPFIDGLLTDTSGGRQGFPLEAMTEIIFAKEIHEEAYPQTKGWTEEHLRW